MGPAVHRTGCSPPLTEGQVGSAGMALQTPGLTLQLQNPLLPQGDTLLNNIFSCQRNELVLTPFIPAMTYSVTVQNT